MHGATMVDVSIEKLTSKTIDQTMDLQGPWSNQMGGIRESTLEQSLVGFTRIAVNFKFHSWFANFKLT